MFTKNSSLYHPDNPVNCHDELPTYSRKKVQNNILVTDNDEDIFNGIDYRTFRAHSQLSNGMVLKPLNPCYDNISQVDNAINLAHE